MNLREIHSNVDKLKIRKAIEAGVPLLITTYTLPHDMEVYMTDVLATFLKELDHEYMTEYLTYCLSELTTNAKKANTKRVYFAEQHLDINNENDYKKGMKTFKKDTMDNINRYLLLQKQARLYIKLLLQVRNNNIKIEIRNNVELTVFEYKRIHDRITRAQQYTSVEDAFNQILDDTEGAGLGLIIMILMLRKIGLSDENFCYISENGETITRIVLPLNTSAQESLSTISEEIISSIDALAAFPENIQHINNLLEDPQSKMSDIAQKISNDVALTADLLKLVNSAAFSLREPCQSITKAIQMVGIRGIKNMLYSIGTIQTLGGNTENVRKLWQHCHQVAFYSYNLARNFYSSDRDIIEDAYICGLLHDIGKVLFENKYTESLSKFEAICDAKNISLDTIERLCCGANHSEIGALIAEKWNFPKVIINCLRFHHSPFDSPNQFKKISCIVYLANMIAQYQSDEIEFYQFDEQVLNELKIRTEDHLKVISDKLLHAFNDR